MAGRSNVSLSADLWTVQFDPPWFYPTEGLSGDQAKGAVVLGKLEDRPTRSKPATRHFSGPAVYRKSFTWSVDAASRRSLLPDLGTIKEPARLTIGVRNRRAIRASVGALIEAITPAPGQSFKA